MRILIIGPFPGILNGQTIMNRTLYEELRKNHFVENINTIQEKNFINKKDQGKFKFFKFFKISFKLILDLFKISFKKYDVIYMTSGQSFLGFIRFFPYVIIAKLKKIKCVNHIHGSKFRSMYNSQNKLKKYLIRQQLKMLDGVILLGNSLKVMLDEIFDKNKIYICENTVEDEVVSNLEEIENKIKNYNNTKKVLYLSNLMTEKGILDLLEATKKIISIKKINFKLTLAGEIEPLIKEKIEKYLENYPNKIDYLGVIKSKTKKKTLLEHDILILPSYDEGQPVCILEAYANGCAVITDEAIGGIKDIFINQENGSSIEARNIESIYNAILKINPERFFKKNYEKFNLMYRKEKFRSKIENILEKIGEKK